MSSYKARGLDMKLEAVVIPVADVERSKRFYGDLGWRLDADFVIGDSFHVVQYTPPGSQCSVHFGKKLSSATPGSASGLFLIVSDIEAARGELIDRGAKVSDVFHQGIGEQPKPGRDPAGRSYTSFATFSDPDGNTWLLQEVTTRLPGRIDADGATYASVADMKAALLRAATAHGEHEKLTGEHDEQWPDWYAEYLVHEQTGQPLPK